jgi:membrane-bound lytic murein transglycosylase F
MDKKRRAAIEWLWLMFLGIALMLLPYSLFHKNALQSVKHSGKLVAVTINGPTTYYEGPDGPVGFEHDLATAFAEHLGVKLELLVADSFTDVFPMLLDGNADIATAGITITDYRKSFLRFSPPYQTIRQQVVYRRGNRPPRKVSDLLGRDIAVVAGSSYAERLEQLQAKHPDLAWTEADDMGPEELLIEVWEGLLELTIADSNIISVARQFYPELHVAFNIQEPEQLAWAFPLDEDKSLYWAAAKFLETMEQSGELDRLRDLYFGPAARSNYIDVTTFRARIDVRLPNYQDLFVEAGKRTGIDWRLLAAQAYQESYWNIHAVSPTGVRGIMQLTQSTAQQLNIENRIDPKASIKGGAIYLKRLRDKLPERIAEPDRTWMALAAYNVGFGHLEDARILTQKQDGDPDKWTDVRERLPLLAKAKWYKQTKHGYARGYEPVQYVRRIRTFYSILVKVDEEERPQASEALQVQPPAI